MNVTEKTKIKEWYCKKFPLDELGANLNGTITFEDLFNVLDSYGDVYKSLGVSDSIVRERAFSKLAEIMGVDYEYVYEQYLYCNWLFKTVAGMVKRL